MAADISVNAGSPSCFVDTRLHRGPCISRMIMKKDTERRTSTDILPPRPSSCLPSSAIHKSWTLACVRTGVSFFLFRAGVKIKMVVVHRSFGLHNLVALGAPENRVGRLDAHIGTERMIRKWLLRRHVILASTQAESVSAFVTLPCCPSRYRWRTSRWRAMSMALGRGPRPLM